MRLVQFAFVSKLIWVIIVLIRLTGSPVDMVTCYIGSVFNVVKQIRFINWKLLRLMSPVHWFGMLFSVFLFTDRRKDSFIVLRFQVRNLYGQKKQIFYLRLHTPLKGYYASNKTVNRVLQGKHYNYVLPNYRNHC